MMMVAPPLGKITKKKLLNCIPEISELSDTQSTSHKAFFFFQSALDPTPSPIPYT